MSNFNTNGSNSVADFEPPQYHHRSTPDFTPTPEPTPPPKPQHNTLAGLKSADAVAFNSAAEELFCVLVLELLDEGLLLTPATVYQECAFELNISIATAKRYLTKHTARRAMFGIDARGSVFQK